MSLPSAERDAVEALESEALENRKALDGPQDGVRRDAYAFLEKTPLDLLAYILAESSNGKAVGKIQNYLNKWKPMRQALPGVATELEALGMERGPKVRQGHGGFLPGATAWAARASPRITPRSCENLPASRNRRRRSKKRRKPEKPKKKGKCRTPASRQLRHSRKPATARRAAQTRKLQLKEARVCKSEHGHAPAKSAVPNQTARRTKSHGQEENSVAL